MLEPVEKIRLGDTDTREQELYTRLHRPVLY